MLDRLCWLALEVKYIERARTFYDGTLGLPVVEEHDSELRLAAGGQQLRLRRPTGEPRGGLHTHFAFATPPERYDQWYKRLSGTHDLEEHTFGSARSLYLYDPDGNCVEIGQRGEGQDGITGIFEVVLEVADLDAATLLYGDLGFEPVDRGGERRRVRTAGPVDLELWEPQLGLADARGGVHVDLGFRTADPERAVETVGDRACEVQQLDGGARVRDPDGHWLTFLEPGAGAANGDAGRSR